MTSNLFNLTEFYSRYKLKKNDYQLLYQNMSFL